MKIDYEIKIRVEDKDYIAVDRPTNNDIFFIYLEHGVSIRLSKQKLMELRDTSTKCLFKYEE